MAAITLRSTKGSALSATELDGNFSELNSRTESLGTLANQASNAVAITGGNISGTQLYGYSEKISALGNVSGAVALDLSVANVFTATVTGNTTFSITNPPASGKHGGAVIYLTNGGAFTIAWPTGSTYGGGTAPSLTAAGTDILALATRDGGSSWAVLLLQADVK